MPVSIRIRRRPRTPDDRLRRPGEDAEDVDARQVEGRLLAIGQTFRQPDRPRTGSFAGATCTPRWSVRA